MIPPPPLPPLLRPNLGPEPWPPPSPWPYLLAAATALILVALSRLIFRRPSAPPPTLPPPPSDPPTLPERVRLALTRALGPDWRTFTTEEIASSPDLSHRFGDEVATHLVAYLTAVDRSKFSPDTAPPDEDLAWWAERFAEEVDAGPEERPKAAINHTS